MRDPETADLVGELGGARHFAGFGPEPLAPDFDLAAFRRRIRARTGRLKSLIIDQAFLAGIGNIYADEALWLARLHPLRRAASLRAADERRLYVALRDILAEAVERRGSSVDDYTAPEGDGEMQEHLQVYQRTGEPCPRCGHPIRRIVVGARSTHFCSFCQRLPASDRAGAAAILRSMTPRPGRRVAPRPSRGRWTELAAPAGVPRTAGQAAPEVTPARRDRTRRAAASRRAVARAGSIRAGMPGS